MAPENKRAKLSSSNTVSEKNSATNWTTSMFSSAVHRLMQDTELADFTVTCGDKEWKVHSNILATRSPFFKAAIATNMTEKREMKMDIKDFDPEAMEHVFNFMYGVPKENASFKFLFEAAEIFQMDDLKEFAVKLARKGMTETNVVELAHFAETYDIEEFFDECAKFIVANEVPLKEEDISSKLAVKVVANLKFQASILKLQLKIKKLKRKFKAASSDCLQNIHLHGNLLEFDRKSPHVGMARAKKPLSTSNHYFEIEIINLFDSGPNSAVVIGLTNNTHSKDVIPGLEEGSIGYHADDGMVYMDSRIQGDPLELCGRGDVMGCGILFPNDYESEEQEGQESETDFGEGIEDEDEDSEEEEDKQEVCSNCREDEDEDSGEEEDKQAVNKHPGRKVHVFFTRNGRIMRVKYIALPKRGFFPTIGWLNYRENMEKIYVNLKPNRKLVFD